MFANASNFRESKSTCEESSGWSPCRDSHKITWPFIYWTCQLLTALLNQCHSWENPCSDGQCMRKNGKQHVWSLCKKILLFPFLRVFLDQSGPRSHYSPSNWHLQHAEVHAFYVDLHMLNVAINCHIWLIQKKKRKPTGNQHIWVLSTSKRKRGSWTNWNLDPNLVSPSGLLVSTQR